MPVSSSRRRAVVALVGAAALLGAFAAPAFATVPTVATGGTGSLTYNSVVLFGTVNPNGRPTVIYYQYGLTRGYGAQSASTELPTGSKAVSISIEITNLAPGTIYHYRIVATNSSGTALGADRTVTTPKIPLSLAIIGTTPNPILFGGVTTITGALTGTGNAGVAVQLQQNPFPYTAGFTNLGNPVLTLADGTFAFNVINVAATTQYRVVSGTLTSPVATVQTTVLVTLNGSRAGTRGHPKIHFSGTITPAEPSSRVAFERLVGTSWRVVGGTVASATPSGSSVTFSTTLRMRAGGTFRALALPVEGAHIAGYSASVVVRLR